MSSCPICLENYTPKARPAVKCQYCPAAACRGCQQAALLNTYEDPHCFSCKQGWSTEFMATNFSVLFRNQTLRRHRRKILFEREKAMLPAMQIFVEAKKKMADIYVLVNNARELYNTTYTMYTNMNNNLHSIYLNYTVLRRRKEGGEVLTLTEQDELSRVKKVYKELKSKREKYHAETYMPAYKAYLKIQHEYARWQRIYNTGEDNAEGGEARQKREFLMRCPAEDCRGFLSTAYKCGTCSKQTCSECLEILVEGTEEHKCKPESVESAKAIKKETRPCPKCGARIFKIDGCDQMWCTVEGCNTAFSWTSGHVVTGRVHNPHYYEWLRRNGGNAAPQREVGDIPCGGIPVAWLFTRMILRCGPLSVIEKNHILDIHRNVTEFEERLRQYPARPDALANKELNVAYLMNQISEAEWQRQLEFAEAKFNRKKEIGQILQTLVTAAAEALQGIVARLEHIPVNDGEALRLAADWIRGTALPMLESLRTYTNDAYVALAKAQHMAVPQISDKWFWQGIRALYKVPKLVPHVIAPVNEVVDLTVET